MSCSNELVTRLNRENRFGDFERAEVVKLEMNALFRRAALENLTDLRAPGHQIEGNRALSSAHINHVIAMVRHVLENHDP